jgi:putative transposase
MAESPRLEAKENFVYYGCVKRYRIGAHTKHNLKLHLIWIPKYRKKIFIGPIVVRVRELIRHITVEHDMQILSGKVSPDYIHVIISYHPHQHISKRVQWLKGTSSRELLKEFPHLRKQLWGRHVWARGYLVVSSGTITDQMVLQHIAEQEWESMRDESQFVIDETMKLPPSRR